MNQRILGFVVAALCSSVPMLAHAQSASVLDPYDTTPSENDVRAAAEFDRGTSLFRSGHPRDAADAFEHSYQLRPRPSTLYNAAQSYRSAGEYLHAIEALERYRREATLTTERSIATQEAIADLQDLVATVTLRPLPASAIVTLDGAPVATSGPIRVDPGTHVVAARATGYAPSAVRLTLRADEQRALAIRLENNSVARQWWFWTGIGSVVTVATVVTVLGLTLPHHSPCGTLNVCVAPQ